MLVLRFMLVMVIYGSGFWVLGSGFRVPGSGFCATGCRMPDAGLWAERKFYWSVFP
jgi:hypothetical protein